MPIEFIGMIGVRPEGADGAAVHVIGGAIDRAWVREFSQAHERAGFDKVLVGYTTAAADGFLVSAYAASHTERLAFLIAHRPGFVAPTLAARKAATLDQFTGGRVALHIITGGSDSDQAKDGDWLDHDTRYRRTDEYLTLLRRAWTEDRPFDHAGEFYRVARAFSEIKPVQKPHIPLYFGGASEAAHAIGAKHCDVYMLWGEPLAAIKQRIADVRAAATRAGRTPGISVSLRPIIAPTHRARGHAGAGGGGAARLSRPRRDHAAHPRLRSPRRRPRVRPRADPARARGSRAARPRPRLALSRCAWWRWSGR
jgi:alkanesulfonate monooxygenase